MEQAKDAGTGHASKLSIAQKLHPVSERGAIHSIIDDTARRCADRIALLDMMGRSKSYNELVAESHQVANLLASRGVNTGDAVAVIAARDIGLPAILLGTLRAGGYYIPLAPDYPETYLAAILDVAQPAAILVARHQSHTIPECWRTKVLPIEETSGAKNDAISRAVSPDQPAYAIYTSGTSGAPKGVLVSHRNVTRLMVAPEYAPLNETSIGLALSPPMFDASVFDLFPFLAAGAKVVMHSNEIPTSESISACVRQHKVTTLFVTTGLFRQIASYNPEAFLGTDVLTGGERGNADDARAVLAAGARSVIHCYGPTETTVFATSQRYTHVSEVRDSFSIGPPVAGTACYVLDANQQPVPRQESGELWIGGEAVALGYLNDAELTDTRFHQDPFQVGGRIYRSGDRVQMDLDGTLIFLDRIDDQVKIRGHRIEPHAIAAAIEALPGVSGAVVLADMTPDTAARLLAYVEMAPTKKLLPDQIRQLLTDVLPAVMIPSAIHVLDKLPLLVNGKTDRSALLEMGRIQTSRAAPAIWTCDQEHRVATSFERVLGWPPENPTDHFFDLGGDSLLAMRLVAEINRMTGAELTLRDVYAGPTIAAIARTIVAARDGAFEEGEL